LITVSPHLLRRKEEGGERRTRERKRRGEARKRRG